jgi:radical SAM protein with 4Fe4S-binding SPASM domain
MGSRAPSNIFAVFLALEPVRLARSSGNGDPGRLLSLPSPRPEAWKRVPYTRTTAAIREMPGKLHRSAGWDAMRGYLRLDLADNCNIRCVMCQAYNRLPIGRINFFDFDLFRERTRGQLAEWGTIQLGNIAEAMIHPKFADFLRYIRSESNATIHIVTNGKLLNRYAALINETGNCLVQVSMDSVRRDVHEYIREGSNYDRLIANLDLLDVKKARVLLSFTLMNSNIGEYDEMVAFCRDREFGMSAFPMILREDDGVIPLKLLTESLWFNMNKLQSWLRIHYGQDYERIVQGAAAGTTNTQVNEFSCDAHENDLSMYGAGTTVLCGKQNLGSLREQSLDEMWHSEEANQFRRQVDADRSPCLTCDYRQRCLAPSMSLLENHFSERILSVLSADVRRSIAFDRNMTDEQALDCFIRGMSNNLRY